MEQKTTTTGGNKEAPKEPQSTTAIVSEGGGVNAQKLSKLGKKDIIQGDEEKKEQDRTTNKKRLFLEIYQRTLGSIGATCEKVEISRETYRMWKINDPLFAQRLKESWSTKLEDVRQQLNTLIIKGDGPSIRYFLDRCDPEFMPKTKTEIIAGSKSAKELLDEFDRELEELEKENGNNTNTTKETDTENKTGENSVHVQDKKQEGESSTIRTEQSTDVLLEKKNEEKPSSESTTKGNLKNNRRGPAPRLHSERN